MKQLVLFLCLAFSISGVAQNQTLFADATKAYNEGDFETAQKAYETILKQGEHSAALYFNLGNTHYKLNHTGPSIYYYEKALLLSPNDAEIKNNLAFAQQMTLDAFETIPETTLGAFFNKIINALGFDQWAKASIACMFLFVLLYVIFYFSRQPQQKRISFIISLLFLVATVTTASLGFINYSNYNKEQPAVVFSAEIQITSEPNTNSNAVFTLHEGTKVNVLDTLDDWNKIALVNGQTGWIQSSHLKLLKNF